MILREKTAICKLSAKVLLGTLAAALVGGCVNPCRGAEVHDVVPEAWLTGDGCMDRGDISTKPGALIFPSKGGSASSAVDFPIPNFLGNSNRFPAKKETFTFSAGGYPNEIKIGVERTAKPSRDLHFSVDIDQVNHIRELGWDAFRQLQKEFATYLLKKSGLAYPLSKPADRFNDFDTHLLEFWSKCLEDAKFADFRSSHLPPLNWDPPKQSEQKPGQISLQAGMRLVIHWGGVANYAFGIGNSYTRQTSSGATSIEIVRRNGVLSFGALSGVKLNAVPPFQQGAQSTASGLPFGKDGLGNFEGKVIPVFNEHDLHFHRDPAFATGHLALFIPYEYTKTDFGRNGSAPFTHDAIEAGPAVGDPAFTKTLGRRFILWGQATPISRDFRPNFTRTEIQNWTTPALVFGNQSWVDVECGISLNSNSLEWVALGTTLVDVLEAHARWALDSQPSSGSLDCLVRLKRATARPDRDGAYSVHEYLFWGVPAREAAAIELHPGDALTLKP